MCPSGYEVDMRGSCPYPNSRARVADNPNGCHPAHARTRAHSSHALNSLIV